MRIVERKHKGAFSELAACQWLLGQGYEVFRNISQHGLADLIVHRGNEILKIDVKTVTYVSCVRQPLSAKQVEAGVAALYVLPDGTCELELSPRSGMAVGVCAKCGIEFKRRNYRHKWCSKKCSSKHFNGIASMHLGG